MINQLFSNDCVSSQVGQPKNRQLYPNYPISLPFSLFLSLSLSLSLSLHTRSRITRKKEKKEEINDVAVTFTDLLRIILLPCLFLSTCC
jgi:hypothetical protein